MLARDVIDDNAGTKVALREAPLEHACEQRRIEELGTFVIGIVNGIRTLLCRWLLTMCLLLGSCGHELCVPVIAQLISDLHDEITDVRAAAARGVRSWLGATRTSGPGFTSASGPGGCSRGLGANRASGSGAICASGPGGAPCAAPRNSFSHPLAMLKRPATALTMPRPLLAAAGSHAEPPPRSLRRTPASPPRAAEALVSGSRHAGWRKTGFFSPALALCCEDLESRGGFAVRPSSDELSARQARTQARELDTENRIRFLCLAGGT